MHLTTGLKSIDDATRGGWQTGKFVGIGGAPGAGKTATIVSLAYRWLSTGIPVAFVASDEDPMSIVTRFGQLIGLSRESCERGEPQAKATLKAWAASVPLILADGSEETSSVGWISKELQCSRRDGVTSVLIADSIQTVRTVAKASKQDAITKTNVVVQELKAAALEAGHLVIATSELARGAYRNKNQSENINPLAAFKQSGDIEYAIQFGLTLVSRPGSPDLIDAIVVKNRLGRGKPEFILQLNHDTGDIREVTVAQDPALEALHETKQRIRTVLRDACGGPMHRTALYGLINGRNQAKIDAVNQMLDTGELFETSRDGVRFALPGDPGYTPTT